MNFLRQGFLKLSCDRQTDRQQDRHTTHIIFLPCRFTCDQIYALPFDVV